LNNPVYIIGDVHGEYTKLVSLLRSAGLIDESLSWSGGDSHLWLMGDLMDRGPSGLKCLNLVMRLQSQALEAGGQVQTLLGNHEVMFLAAYESGSDQTRSAFVQAWLRNGGILEDMRHINRKQILWLRRLPAMALVEDRLLIHADANLYTQYGRTIDAVNEHIATILQSDESRAWKALLDAFTERMSFFDLHHNGTSRAEQMLGIFGGRQIVHGHTPIHYMEPDLRPQDIREPLSYARNLCINVDGGMYSGGTGFVYRLLS
jgi:hypothetical protein